LPFTQIVAGGTHTCALEVGGRAYCWGDNRQSQIGQDRTKFNYRNWPQLILGEAEDPE
jgi:alpha-tubulin suppressor-like RCC1 family protein